MTDTSIIDLYFIRSEQANEESQVTYGGYCYRVANGILNDPADSEESVNDTWFAAWNAIPPTRPNSLSLHSERTPILGDRIQMREHGKYEDGSFVISGSTTIEGQGYLIYTFRKRRTDMYSFHSENKMSGVTSQEIARLLRSIGASGRLVGFHYTDRLGVESPRSFRPQPRGRDRAGEAAHQQRVYRYTGRLSPLRCGLIRFTMKRIPSFLEEHKERFSEVYSCVA